MWPWITHAGGNREADGQSVKANFLLLMGSFLSWMQVKGKKREDETERRGLLGST